MSGIHIHFLCLSISPQFGNKRVPTEPHEPKIIHRSVVVMVVEMFSRRQNFSDIINAIILSMSHGIAYLNFQIKGWSNKKIINTLNAYVENERTKGLVTLELLVTLL